MSRFSKVSKQLKKLRIKHIMDWEELDRKKLEGSPIYKAISVLGKLLEWCGIKIKVSVKSIKKSK